MTTQMLVEQVKMSFSHLPDTLVIFRLNQALRLFVEKTNVLTAITAMSQDNLVESNDEDGIYKWELPEGLYQVIESDFFTNEEMQVRDGYLYTTHNDTSITSFTLEYSRYPDAMINLTDTVDLPDVLCDTLVAWVTMEQYLLAGNPVMAQMMQFKWLEGIKAGLRHFNTRRLRQPGAGSGGTVKKTTFKQGVTLVEGENTITMDVTFTSSTSYTVLLNGNGVSVNEPNPPERTRNTFKVIAAEATSNFEYMAIGT